ncbi:MAG TPA: hypothetical protein VM261_29005 [Kofleriaceae bacterium]|nr:hypothetical protein [Kofleriaceae bacterium]
MAFRGSGRAMQRFMISFAKNLNRELGRRGTVFADRYHTERLETPAQVKNALACWRTCSATGGSTARVVASRDRSRAPIGSRPGRLRRLGDGTAAAGVLSQGSAVS